MDRIDIPTTDGQLFDAFLFAPAQTPAAGIVMIPEIFGVNPSLIACAELFAREGFVVLVPDIFWRLQRNVCLGYDEEGYRQAFAYHKAFDYELGTGDICATITVLRARSACTGRIAAVGFCLGGTVAYLAASRCGVDAAVSYYGTRIQNFLGDAERIDCPTILNFGEQDHTTPPEILNLILPAVGSNDQIRTYLYPEAGHAFANAGRPDTYRPEAAAIAHRRTFELFARVLRRP